MDDGDAPSRHRAACKCQCSASARCRSLAAARKSAVGSTDVDEAAAACRPLPGRRRQPVRYGRRLRGARPSGCSARRSKGRRDEWSWRPRSTVGWGRTERRRAVAPPHLTAARPACGGWAPTRSTCTRCTLRCRRHRSRRRCGRSTTWCGPARSATSAARTLGLAPDEVAGRLRRRLRAVRAQQIYYSLLGRDSSTSWCRSRSPRGWDPGLESARGRLPVRQVRARRGRPEGTRFAAAGRPGSVRPRARVTPLVEAVAEIAEARGVSPAAGRVNWLPPRAGVTSISSARATREQLESNLGAVRWSSPKEEITRLER